jgi:hypothetical protein
VGDDIQHGIPIGFQFKYMQGPVEGLPTYGWTDPDGIPDSGDEIWEPQEWNIELTDEGYDELYVAINGYVVFDTGNHRNAPGPRPAACFDGLGTWAWDPRLLPSADIPNNFIAPYWSHLAVTDNSFEDVTAVGFFCALGVLPDPECAGGEPFPNRDCCVNGEGWWAPIAWRTVNRPRGRLLYQTEGTEPNRKFVVQWSNAKNAVTGNLATFQVQLWEHQSKILFLYKSFTTKAHYEDPPHGDTDPYFVSPGVLVGMEDWYGDVGPGWLYLPERTASTLPVGRWQLFNPVPEFAVIGWIADDYVGPGGPSW